MTYASGKHALAICPRCGFRCKLNSMREEHVRGKATRRKVCPSCWDPDHPQNWAGFVDARDGFPLRDPRPDPDAGVSGLFSWRPILGLEARGAAGNVKVVTT